MATAFLHAILSETAGIAVTPPAADIVERVTIAGDTVTRT